MKLCGLIFLVIISWDTWQIRSCGRTFCVRVRRHTGQGNLHVGVYVRTHTHTFYLFLERREGREEGREEVRERNILPLSRCHPPPAGRSPARPRGPSPQLRQVPPPGMEPATFWVASWLSTHRATPARAYVLLLKGVHPGGSPVPARG